MNVEHAAACVAYLTSMTTGWNDDATEQMVYEFERLPDEAALTNAIQKVARTWEASSRPPLAVIMDAYHHEVRLADDLERERAARENERIRCDGSGWRFLDDETTRRPCATCNPALARIFADPDLLRRWRDGFALHRLLGYDGRKELVDETARPPCFPAGDDDSIDRLDGIAIAVNEYRRTHQGREPSEAMMNVLLRVVDQQMLRDGRRHKEDF